MWPLTWQHLRRHWQLNLIVLATITLAAALLASLPMLAIALADQHLDQIIDDAPVSGRNILVRSQALPATVAALFNNNTLTEVVADHMEIWEFNSASENIIVRPDGPEEIPSYVLDRFRIHMRSFSNLDAHTTLIEGRYATPNTDPQAAEVEIVIGRNTSEEMDIHVGDGVVLTEADGLLARVVGIVEPTHPFADRWWGDQLLLPFGIWKRLDLEEDFLEVTMGALAHPDTMTTHFPSERSWRVLIDHEQINAFNAVEIANELRAAEVTLTGRQIELDTQLVQLVDSYRTELDQAQVSLLLLSGQALLAVAYTLILISGFMLEQSQHELVTLLGRGMSKWQVLRLFGTEAAVLAFGLALPLGVSLSWALFALTTDQTVLPPNSGWLALLGVTISWLAIVIPLMAATQRNTEEWLRQQHRAEVNPFNGRRLIFDVVLLALGGLFYWQLRQTGQVTAEPFSEATGTADPLLLLGPTMLLLAIALLFTRLFPLLLRVFAWISSQSTGFITPLSLTRLARDTAAPSRVVFLISLTTGLTFFAIVYEQSLTIRQQEMALYRAGADVRFRPPTDTTELPKIEPVWETWDGVTTTADVFRGRVRSDDTSATIDLLAVEVDTFAAVSAYPQGLSEFSLTTILNTLQPTQDDVVPVVVSSANVIPGLKIGDVLTMRMGNGGPDDRLQVEVRGIIHDFPTLRSPFMITDLALLQAENPLDNGSLLFPGTHERWLAVEEEQHTAVVEKVLSLTDDFVVNRAQILGDRLGLLESYQADLISQQVMGAFRLNAAVLILLSAAAFLTVQLFSARQRLPTMSVLRALGVSRIQLGRLLTLEGVLMLGFGLAAGIGIGIGMARMMSPFLTLTLSASIGGSTEAPLIYNWFSLGQFLILLAGLYLLALFIFGRRLNQQQLLHTLRLGEE